MKNSGATQTQNIRVVYPGENGRIVLRTNRDWEGDLDAHSVSREDCCWEFAIETTQPFFILSRSLFGTGQSSGHAAKITWPSRSRAPHSRFIPTSATTRIAVSAN